MSSDSEHEYGVSISIQEEKSPTEVYAAGVLSESETQEDGLDQSSKGFLYFPSALPSRHWRWQSMLV